MDAKTYVLKQINSMHFIIEDPLQGLTDDLLRWTPPGMANRIGVTLLHTIAGQDVFTGMLLGQPTLWVSESWDQRFGLEKSPGPGMDWNALPTDRLTLENLCAYLQSVRNRLESYLQALTPEELDRKVDLFGKEQPAADVLILMAGHSLMHAGEIAALKGIAGVRGLAF